MTGSFVPAARSTGLLESEVDGELVLYDVEHDRAHALNPAALALWRACDGRTDVARLAEGLTMTEELVWFGLAELSRQGLLDTPLPAGAADRRIARRAMLKKAAIGVAVPTVISIVAPDHAAAGQSSCRTLGQTCTGGNVNCIPRGTCCVGLRCCLDLCIL